MFSSVHLHCSCSHMHDTPLQVWARKGSNPPLKARRDQHCRKVMLTLFFDCLGPLRIEFLSEGATINAERYVQTLTGLKADIHNKRRNGSKPQILLHDNARPHTAVLTKQALQRLHFDPLCHPPYSPDLAPADYALFPRLKRLLRGRIFESRDSLENEVRHVLLYELPRDDFAVAIDSLPSRWK